MANQLQSYDDFIQFLEDNEKEKIREIFELFDKNLDGGIDIKELKFILNCMKIIYIALDIFPSHDELSQMMNEADIDNKGYISIYIVKQLCLILCM